MTMTHSSHSRRRLDTASLLLLLLSLACAGVAYWLITDRGFNPLVLVPSIVAATSGAAHLVKHEVPHE